MLALVLYVSSMTVVTLWASCATYLLVRQRREGPRSPSDIWKGGFNVGMDYGLNGLSRLLESLRAVGPTHKLHDIEVACRKARDQVKARSKGAQV
jgi:hypothetical protein